MTQLITMASLRCPMYGKLLGFRQLFLLNLASGYSALVERSRDKACAGVTISAGRLVTV